MKWILGIVIVCLLASVTHAGDIDREYYAVMFTASWCQPCHAYKHDGRLDRLKARFATTVVDVDECPEWRSRVASVPTFWLVRYATRTKVKSWSGATDVETIEREVIRIRDTTTGTTSHTRTVTQSRTPAAVGRAGTSFKSITGATP